MSAKFQSMISIIPEGELGAARVEHFEVDRNASMMTSFRPGDYVPAGEYARLRIGGQLVMSDTPMEQRTNYEVVRRAHGRVLIGGLGLGMILVPILRKKEVREVVVIEKSPDVVTLITPHFPSRKLTVIAADVFDWKPPKGEKFNTVYFDIWADQSTDDLQEMAQLHQRFKFHLDRTDDARWMGSWRQEELRYQKRQDDRNDWWRR